MDDRINRYISKKWLQKYTGSVVQIWLIQSWWVIGHRVEQSRGLWNKTVSRSGVVWRHVIGSFFWWEGCYQYWLDTVDIVYCFATLVYYAIYSDIRQQYRYFKCHFWILLLSDCTAFNLYVLNYITWHGCTISRSVSSSEVTDSQFLPFSFWLYVPSLYRLSLW